MVLLVSVAGSAARAGSEGGSDRDRRYYDEDQYRDRDWDHRYRDDHHHGKYKKHKKYKGHDRYDHYDHGYRGSYYTDRRPPHFVVPPHLYHRDYRTYDRYYRGSTYYAPHRHSHRVYLFPVIVDGYYTEYRPYAYCGEAYYPDQYRYGGSGGHLGPHFDF